LHIRGHRIKCQERYSLEHLFGVGQSDGEGPERNWSFMGPVGTSTWSPARYFGQSFWVLELVQVNWLRYVVVPLMGQELMGYLGPLLKRRLQAARDELQNQEEVLAEFTLNHLADAGKWQREVLDFEADPDSSQNLFSRKGKSMAFLSLH